MGAYSRVTTALKGCALALLVIAGCHGAGTAAIPGIEVARSSRGMIAFVKPTPHHIISTALEQEQATQLWVAAADGSHARKLLEGAPSDSIEHILADFSDPGFSPDGRRVYFLSSAWVTSKAVHAVDLQTGREWYVAPGNTLEVIPRGEFAGCLLVAQHRYSPERSGSFDWVWILRPDGREIGHAADDSETAEKQLADWKRANVPPESRDQSHGSSNTHCND